MRYRWYGYSMGGVSSIGGVSVMGMVLQAV